MRKSFRSLLVILLIAIMTTSLLGCAKSGSLTDYAGSAPEAVLDNSLGFYEKGDYSLEESLNTETISSNENANISQKLVYTARLGIETKNYDNAIKNIRAAVSEMNGYIENTNSYTYGSSNRHSEFKIRIPVSSYSAFLTQICEIGSVMHQGENVEDITSQYLDVEARLQSLNEKMTRLKELQSMAEDIEKLLIIENQISDTQYQIENYTSQMNYMKNRVAYCTVNIDLNEVIAYTESSTFLSEITETHKDSIENFVRFLKDLCLFVVRVYPYIILASLLVVTISFIRKKKGKHINLKKLIPLKKAKEENK